MKFIGQFIQNFIARFRNDVYLEDVESGTIADGSNLGLDADNKIVKASIAADVNTTYAVSCVDGDNSDEEKIRLTGSDSSTDDVVLEAGTGLSIARSGDKITFTNTVSDTDTNTQNTYAISCVDGDNSDEEKIRLTQGGADGAATDDVVLEAGTGLSIARDGDKITFTNTVSDTDTNTQLSNAEVRAAVEAASDSNVFTDADHTKLNGIEASADVTDTTNVTAAGALMDSEVTNLADVKSFDTSDYATAAQGAKADSAQQPPSEGAFANGDKTKLDGIEASADVTDTTNVTAAGALMDSELTDLAGVKGVTISTLQVKPSEGAFANGDKTKLDNIETGATTDQTNAEIRTAVEAASDSNVFTDADHTKLNGIEASATADQTAGEIRTLLGTGNGNLVPAEGSDGDFLKHDGTFGTPSYTTNTNTQLSDEQVQDIVGAMLVGTETRIGVTYDDTNGRINFVVDDMTADTNTNQLTTFTLTGDGGSDQTIAHGNTLDIAGGNAITTAVGATDTLTINHDDTSSQASVNNSGSTYIQDVTLDTYGHVTGLTSAAIPTLNQDTTGEAGTVATIDGLAPNTATTQATQPNITTLDGLTSFGSAGATTDVKAGDLTMYNAVNNGNPSFSIGSSATNRLVIQPVYNSGAQTVDYVEFNTFTTSTSNHDGRYFFKVDEVEIARLIDTGALFQGLVQTTGDGARLVCKDTDTSSTTKGAEVELRTDDGAAMGDNHRLGIIKFTGAEDASNSITTGAQIEAFCEAAWSSSENGGRLVFSTTDGNASTSVVLTLDSNKLATFAGAISIAGNLTFDSVALTAVQTASESFADNDTSIMTSAAIDDRINAAVFTPNYSLLSSSGTTTTSTTAGEGNAVVIPYDTEDLVSSTNTVILTGSGGLDGISNSTYAWYSATQGDWEYQWNVMTNTNIVNNRILNGVKLQRGTHNGSTMTWTDYDPSTSFIYDRGTGTVRKGSTTNQTLVTQGGTQYYWRLVIWKEAASNTSMNAITVVTGVSLIVKQIS